MTAAHFPTYFFSSVAVVAEFAAGVAGVAIGGVEAPLLVGFLPFSFRRAFASATSFSICRRSSSPSSGTTALRIAPMKRIASTTHKS